MISLLKGQIIRQSPTGLVVLVAGVGYDVKTTPQTKAQLETGSLVELEVCQQVREDRLDLYGFLDLATKEVFEQLLKVSGVGPKAALSLLSLGDLKKLGQAINRADVGYLTQAPGLGRRTAERVVVDLKDKLAPDGSEISLLSETGGLSSEPTLKALKSLGLKETEARAALAGIDPDLPDSERLRLALANRDKTGG